MDEDKLKRVFDQIKPTQEQERVMLDRLLTEQKEVKPVSRMKKMPAVLAAAAVLLLACAFTVATGLDQRFAALFGAGEQETRLIKDGVVQVDQRHTYENGWTVEVEQMLVDRYTLAVLLDVIGPEETALWGEDYSVLATSDIEPESEENGVGGWVSGSIVLPDDDPGDHHISILWYRGPTTYLQADAQTFLGGEFTITPLRLVEKTTFENLADFSQERHDFCVKLPDQDSGRQYEAGLPIQVGEDNMVLQSLYVSPISVAFMIQGEENDFRMWGPAAFSEIESTTVLNLLDGQTASVGRTVSQSYNPDTGMGEFVFQLNQIVDPDEVTSLTILGQTFSLGGLLPVEE